MKKIYILIILVSSILISCSNNSIDDIINRNLIARGGEDKWNSISDAAYGFNFQVQGIEMPIFIYKKGIDKINLQMGMGVMGLTTIINGKDGWNNVMSKIDTLKEESLNKSKFQLQTQYLLIEPFLFKYKEKGYSLSNDGIEKVGKEEWYKIIAKDEKNNKITVFVDKSTWLEKRIDTEVESNKTKKILSIFLDEYKIIDGKQLPHLMTIKMDDKETGKIVLKESKFNSNMSDSLFMAPIADTSITNKHKMMHGMGMKQQ